MNPFIKWAGGKRRFAEQIVGLLGTSCNHYYEPFLGGGAILLYGEYQNATCMDINPELINLYDVIKDDVVSLIKELSEFFVPNHSKDFYYEIRGWDRDPLSYNQINPIRRAARFMYLNRTCYNGLWRVNGKGENNVPFGRYVNPPILQADSLLAASQYFNTKNVSFCLADYHEVGNFAGVGDIVYFDPPYDVEVGQNGFVSYTQEGFNRQDQRKLKELCDLLILKGVKVGISNSNTSFIRELYTEGPYDFYNLYDEISVKRTIGGTPESRREIHELFIIGENR